MATEFELSHKSKNKFKISGEKTTKQSGNHKSNKSGFFLLRDKQNFISKNKRFYIQYLLCKTNVQCSTRPP